MDWGRLIDERDLAELLPGEYARFAGPVRMGLMVFLAGLSAERQGEILARQAALGAEATLSVRLGALARSCPLLHKLGQVLARDRRLAPALRDQLRPLEQLPPAVPEAVIQSELTRELGPLAECGVELLDPALAEASVAVVVPYRLGPDGEFGVLKLLKPGIEARLDEELQLLTRVGARLDEQCHDLGLPPLDYRESFVQVHVKLASEVRLDEEQRHLTLAAQLYGDEPHIHIPRLFPEHCTRRVTAMERIFGVPITDHALTGPAARRRLARTLARALVARPMLASGNSAAFHCDPHAGNLLHTRDGRIAILDWSLVARLSAGEREALTQILLAALTLDHVQIRAWIERLAMGPSLRRGQLNGVIENRLRQLRRGGALGVDWLIGLFDDASLQAGLRTSAELMLVRKSFLMLEGVLADLADDQFALDHALTPDFIRQFACELPTRWMAPFGSREFGTRISNRDLLRLAWNWPRAMLRWRQAAGP